MTELALFIGILVVLTGFTLIDKKFKLGLNSQSSMAWLNDPDLGLGLNASGDLNDKDMQQTQVEKTQKKQIQALKKRVEVLEAIVTSSGYDLKQKIDAL